MATVTESKARFDELRLSGKVFLSNKTAVVGLAIFLVFIGDAFLVQVAPGVLGVQYPDSVVPPQFTQTNPECFGTAPEAPSFNYLLGTIQYGLSGLGFMVLVQLLLTHCTIYTACLIFRL